MICPNCGETIVNEYIVDTEYHNCSYYDIVTGTCPNCDKTWQWLEVFTYSHDEEIEEVTEA